MNPTQSINIREIAYPSIISMVLFSAAIFLSPLGLLFSIFCPIPIVLAYLYRSQKTGILSMVTVTIVLALFLNVRYSVIFFVEYGLVAVVMAESIRRKYSIGKILFLSLGASLLLGGALIYALLLSKDLDLSSLMAEQIKFSIASSTDLYREMGFSSIEIDKINLYSDKMTSIVVNSMPALMVLSSSFGILINYVLTKTIWNKYVGNNSYFENESLERWSSDESLIWILIGSGTALLLPLKGLNTIGLNLLIISLLAYFYQGLAIIVFLMRKKTFPFFVKVIAYLLIIIQPILLFFIIFLGIFDMWADFRKLKTPGNNHNAIV